MTESAAPVTAAATPSFRILLHRFAVPMLWFFIGVTFLIGLTPYRLLPDVFLFACAFVWFKKPQLRRARVLCLVLTGFLLDRKSTRLNSSHRCISYAVFC